MAGIYLHIPFCRNKCAYCDFYSMPLSAARHCGGEDVFARYARAVMLELDLRLPELDEPVYTIYIGGGTPTAMPQSVLLPMLSQLKSAVERFNCRLSERNSVSVPVCEIGEFTIEANPEDISDNAIDRLCSVGVDRISIGVQSFDGEQLQAVDRRHSADMSLKALETLSRSGINYSADLIYGLPGQTAESWQMQLDRLLDFRPPHFSAYLLSYEPGTRLYALRENGRVEEASEETAVAMYDALCKVATNRGYNHYEISNFSLPGREAVHNSSYWNLTPYLGLGCSAHSFDGEIRRINPANLSRYLRAIERGATAADIEEETLINRVNDNIITALRTSGGLSIDRFRQLWGAEITAQFLKNIRSLSPSSGLILSTDSIRISETHWLTADAILREIIL